MSEPLLTVREENLLRLEPFCRALAQALIRSGIAPDRLPETFGAGLEAECVRCDLRLSGEELFALSQPPSEQYGSPKLGRLRLGDCARAGCKSYFYRLTFRNSPSLDWRALIAQAEAIQQEGEGKSVRQISAQALLRQAAQSKLLRRVALALVIALVLLVARQYYRGGRIPLLREPEHFRVTIAPAGEE